MKLTDIIERRAAVDAEMRSIYDAAETAGQDLAGEKLERWNSLKTERDDLAAKEARARTRDDLDRAAPARIVGQETPEDSAYGLTREQRMADHLKATTGLSAEGLSVGRVVRALVTGKWEGAEAERRAMGSVTGTAGGFFVPEPVAANVIDLARNAAVMVQAGALTIPMTSNNLRVVRVLADPTAHWRGEGQAITESDASFGALNLTAHSLAALVRVNAELMDDAPMFAATLDNSLAQALALKMDYAALYGTGAGMPLGIRNCDGVAEETMGTDGAAPADYDDFLDLAKAIELANGSPSTLIWSPRTKNTLAKIVTGITSDKTKLAPPADFLALRRLVSNQVSVTETQGSNSDASTAFMGGFENTAFALRQTITIEASQVADTAFAKNQVLVRAIMRGDFAIFRPSQLGRLIGIRA